jgi:hypothetical protein
MPSPPAPSPGYPDRVLILVCIALIILGIAMSFW